MAAPAAAPVRVPRAVTLIAFVGIVYAVNRAAPEVLPAILVLLVLYAALTNLDRVQALIGGYENSVVAGFVKPRTTAHTSGK